MHKYSRDPSPAKSHQTSKAAVYHSNEVGTSMWWGEGGMWKQIFHDKNFLKNNWNNVIFKHIMKT